jgi:predicted enzyme related to lactoylglutathione lyase
MISRTVIPNAAAKIEFTTTDKKWYSDTKAILSKTGYRFINDEKRTMGGIQTDMHNFTNGKCHVTLYSYTTDVTWYAAQVHY